MILRMRPPRTSSSLVAISHTLPAMRAWCRLIAHYRCAPYWTKNNPALIEAIRCFSDERFSAGKTRASTVERWTGAGPIPVFTAVPFFGFDDASEFADIIDSFAEAAARAVAESGKGESRPFPLLAMPVIGSGGGGGAEVLGDLIRVVLDAAERAASRHLVDIVVVVRSAAQMGLAQRIRRENSHNQWNELPPDLKQTANELAADCISGNVVPFLGAGISISAGAPSWPALVSQLTTEVANQLTDAEKSSLAAKGPPRPSRDSQKPLSQPGRIQHSRRRTGQQVGLWIGADTHRQLAPRPSHHTQLRRAV
jgi:hypothetical protein